jgi:uncharacterized protein
MKMLCARVGGCVLSLVLVAVALPAAAGPSSPLIDAVKASDAKALRVLVRTTDVNRVEADGTSALHWAAYRGDAAIVDLLLRAGAKPSIANRYGVTPVTLAAQKGNAAVLTRLLDAGADPNTTVTGGETPLMAAARVGEPESRRTHLAHWANVDAR